MGKRLGWKTRQTETNGFAQPFYLPSLPHLFVCSPTLNFLVWFFNPTTFICLVQYVGLPNPPHTCVSFVLAERLGKQRHMSLPRVPVTFAQTLVFAQCFTFICQAYTLNGQTPWLENQANGDKWLCLAFLFSQPTTFVCLFSHFEFPSFPLLFINPTTCVCLVWYVGLPNLQPFTSICLSSASHLYFLCLPRPPYPSNISLATFVCIDFHLHLPSLQVYFVQSHIILLVLVVQSQANESWRFEDQCQNKCRLGKVRVSLFSLFVLPRF